MVLALLAKTKMLILLKGFAALRVRLQITIKFVLIIRW